MTTALKEVGSIRLGTERYRLVRDNEGRAYRREFLSEPPYSDGAPPMMSAPQSTWHLGGLKSREGIPGTSEYGQDTDTRFPGRLLPGPKVNTITLPNSTTTPTSIFEAMDMIWVVAGRYVFMVDPSDDSVTEVMDFGSTVNGVMGIKWEEEVGLVTTDAAAKSLWRITIGAFQSGAFSASGFAAGGVGFQQSLDVEAYRLATGINRMFKVDKFGVLKNILTAKDPMVEANYSDEIQCGGRAAPTGLVAYERTAFVAKPEGLFGVDIDGFGVSLIKRVTRADDNGLGTEVYDPYVLYPHARGLYRFVPGLVEASGIERETMNESPIKGPFKAFVVDGQWLFGALNVGSDTYIMVARDRRGDPGLGPFVWDTWIFLSAKVCQAMVLSSLSSPPRMWFGYGNDLAYIKQSTSAGAPDVDGSGYEFALSGKRWSNKFFFGDWGDKDYPKIDVVGRGTLSATRFWDIFYSVDGGAFSSDDIDSEVMRVNSDGRKTFFLPSSAVGREIQLRFDYTGDSASAPGELVYTESFAVPQSRKIPVYIVRLYLAAGLHYDQTIETRTSLEQFNNLETLLEQVTSVDSYGPWGDNKNVWVRSLSLTEVRQEGDQEPEFVVDVFIQRREEA